MNLREERRAKKKYERLSRKSKEEKIMLGVAFTVCFLLALFAKQDFQRASFSFWAFFVGMVGIIL